MTARSSSCVPASSSCCSCPTCPSRAGRRLIRSSSLPAKGLASGSQWKQGKYRDHRYYEDKAAGLDEKKRHKGRIAQMIKYAEAVVGQHPDDPDAPMDVRLVSCGEAVSRPNPTKERTKLDRDRLGRDTRYTDRYAGTT